MQISIIQSDPVIMMAEGLNLQSIDQHLRRQVRKQVAEAFQRYDNR